MDKTFAPKSSNAAGTPAGSAGPSGSADTPDSQGPETPVIMPPSAGDPRRPRGPRDPGDAWVDGPRGRFWGRFGSAGLLVRDPAKGVLLQHRVEWSDHGGTWGLPGGALHQGEDAIHGALREAREEAGVPPESIRVLFTSVFDVGYWSYTTVTADVCQPFEPVIMDPESLELRWVPVDTVGRMELHPGFAAAWPALRSRLQPARTSTGRTPDAGAATSTDTGEG